MTKGILLFQEWEVLLLSKLDWDMSAVIASDFVEHIIQRVCRLRSPSSIDPSAVRSHSEALITMCSAHHSFSGLSPSLVAAACVLVTLSTVLLDDADKGEEARAGLDGVLEAVERFTLIDKVRGARKFENLISGRLAKPQRFNFIFCRGA